MNIQISVVLWTVICFFILLFILHNLLFQPMLSHLDKRNKRISQAQEKQKADEKILADLISKAQQEAQELRESAKAEAEKKVLEEQAKFEHILESLRKDEQIKIESYKSELEEEKGIDLKQLDQSSYTLAELFIGELLNRAFKKTSK